MLRVAHGSRLYTHTQARDSVTHTTAALAILPKPLNSQPSARTEQHTTRKQTNNEEQHTTLSLSLRPSLPPTAPPPPLEVFRHVASWQQLPHSMSFIIDFFTNAQNKEREPAASRAEDNAARLKGYQAMEEKQRQYVQWCERKPKVPFANEKSHPMVRR